MSIKINLSDIEKLLHLGTDTVTDPVKMASNLKITFAPNKTTNSRLSLFSERLKQSLQKFGVEIIPFNESRTTIPLFKVCKRIIKIFISNLMYFVLFQFPEMRPIYIPLKVIVNTFKRLRIKKGIATFVVEPNEEDNLVIDITESFTSNPIITIFDAKNINFHDLDFVAHFDKAMTTFAKYMTHIAIFVGNENFVIYNFNASHPIFSLNDIDNAVLTDLIPKIYAPIMPMKLDDFKRVKGGFDLNDDMYKDFVNDLVNGSRMLGDKKVYPDGKSISSLPFKNTYYKWIGSLHLDHRSGMSYGFIARQLPSEFCEIHEDILPKIKHADDFISIHINDKQYFLSIPSVSILTQRSGCNKTNMNPINDTIKIGIDKNTTFLQTPQGYDPSIPIKPSFDTKVILAHAIGNVIIGSILSHIFGKDNEYSKQSLKSGFAIVHWHGYVNKHIVPRQYYSYGYTNPNVACSSPQSAVYALMGKLEQLEKIIQNLGNIKGDIHVEPHHGTNMTLPLVTEFNSLLESNPNFTELGNKYL